MTEDNDFKDEENEEEKEEVLVDALDFVNSLVYNSVCKSDRKCLMKLKMTKLASRQLLVNVLNCIDSNKCTVLSLSNRSQCALSTLLACASSPSPRSTRIEDEIMGSVLNRFVNASVQLYCSIITAGQYRRKAVMRMLIRFYSQRKRFACIVIRDLISENRNDWNSILFIALIYKALNGFDAQQTGKLCQEYVAGAYKQTLINRQNISFVNKDAFSYVASMLSDDIICSTILNDIRRSILRDALFSLPILQNIFEHCQPLSSMNIISQLFLPLEDQLLSKDERNQNLASSVLIQMLCKYENHEAIVRTIVNLIDLIKGGRDRQTSALAIIHRCAVLKTIGEISANRYIDFTLCISRILSALINLASMFYTSASSFLFLDIMKQLKKWCYACFQRGQFCSHLMSNIPNEIDTINLCFDELATKEKTVVIDILSICSKVDCKVVVTSKLFSAFIKSSQHKTVNFVENMEYIVRSYTFLLPIWNLMENSIVFDSCVKSLEQITNQYIKLHTLPFLDIDFYSDCFSNKLNSRVSSWLFILSFMRSHNRATEHLNLKAVSGFSLQRKSDILNAFCEVLSHNEFTSVKDIRSKCSRLLIQLSTWLTNDDIQNPESKGREEYIYGLLICCCSFFVISKCYSSKEIAKYFKIPFALYDQLGNSHIQLLNQLIANERHSSQINAYAIGCLCDPSSFVSKEATDLSVLQIYDEISSADFIFTSANDMAIYQGKDGILADHSIIDKLMELEASDVKHMKKQSKSYSFAEQMSDILLRKEMIKSDKWQSQLTHKQSEFLKRHLEGESQLRKRMVKVEERCRHTINCLIALLTSNFEYVFSKYFKRIFNIISCHLPSQITSNVVSKLIDFIVNRLSLSLREQIVFQAGLCYAAVNPIVSENMTSAIYPINESASQMILSLHNEYSTIKMSILSFKLISFIPLFEFVLLKCKFLDEKNAILELVDTWCNSSPINLYDRRLSISLLQIFLKLSEESERCTGIQLKLIRLCSRLYKICFSESNNHYRSDVEISSIDEIGMEAIKYSVASLVVLDKPTIITIVVNGLQPIIPMISTFPFKFRLKLAELGRIFSFFESDSNLAAIAQMIFQSCNLTDLHVLNTVVCYSVIDMSFVSIPATKCLIDIINSNGSDMWNEAFKCLKLSYASLISNLRNKSFEKQRYAFDENSSSLSAVAEIRHQSLSSYSKCFSTVVQHCFSKYDAFELVQFLVDNVLCICDLKLPSEFLSIAMSAVNYCSDNDNNNAILNVIEFLEHRLKSLPDSKGTDRTRTCLLVLMGASVKNITNDLAKVNSIVEQLIDALRTPSEMVQEAVANSISMLVPMIKENAITLIEKLFNIVFKSSNYAERKGASYGIAGIIKGLGVLCIKQLDIMNKIEVAIRDKTEHENRTGALLVTSAFVRVLGWVFEIYLVHLLPDILMCFSDRNDGVRSAAENCGKNIMTKISAQGIRLIVPAILNGLESDKWRTKCGSADLLGAMSYCDSEQLATSLPSIIPGLIDMISDTHMKVQKSGIKAIERIASVISDREMKELTPKLINALQNPDNASVCIDALYRKDFIFGLDPVSLALVLPVLTRGFGDRILNVRKKCGDIIVQITNSTSKKEIMPYISTLQSLSKQRIFDPVPEIREMASRILAAVLCKSDIQNTKEILSWLAERIVDDKNNITRLGAAQCTCEIAYACGDNLLRDHMEIALNNIEGGSNHYVVHGYYAFCLFVSKRSFDVFSKFLMRIMPCILRSLADEIEIVRDAAYNVGQSMVDLYFDECADKLLPEIEEHLFASDWRIRFSSLKLMSEMLFKIVGQVEQSEGSQSDRCYTVLTKFLGQDRIDRILTELFIFCNDQVSQVAQYSMHTWKVIITNTSMVLNQIMPTFLTCIFERLSQSQDNLIREIIARALGDLIRRLGDVSFEKVLLIILEQISSKNQQCLEGSCSALKEIFSTCSKDILISQFEQVSDLLKKLLCDSDPTVRDLAAQAFLQFDQVVGRPRIADFFLPNYIEYISSEIEKDSEHKKNVIDGFVKMLQCTGTNFVNYALNVLLRSKNLSMDLLLSACEVSGSSGFKYINHIVHCVMDDLSKAEPGNKDIAKAATTLANITNSETLLTVVNMLCDKCNEELDKFDENTFNCDSVILLNHFIKLCESNSKLSEATHQIERLSFRLCSFRYEILNNHTCFEPAEYLRNMWAAGYDLIEQFIKRMSFNDYVKIFASLDQSIRGLRYVKPMVNSIPGWNIKGKGFKPIMHVYRELIHNHDEQVKDSVMASLLKLLYLCGNDSIRVSSFSMIGSIIRILGERQSDQSRFLMLSILNKLLPAIGDHLKMFVPQLLPTFTRFLPCQHVDVFKQALIGFRLIAPLKPRCEYLLRDVYPTIMSYPDSKLDDLHNNHEDFLQLLEQTWKGVFTIVICFEFSEISLTTEQVDQLQGILNRARFLSSLSTEFDMNDSPFSDGSKNISQAVILTCRRLKRLCGALDFILSYINEDLAQIKTDWNNNPVAKYLERRLAQLSVNADVCEALSSICVLFHRFPLVVNHRGDHINKLESLCAHVYLKSEFQIDFLRTLGFLTLARYSVPKEEPAVQKRFNTLSTDFLAKIIVSNSAANNFPLAVDFALRSLSCTNVNDTLARSVIALAISTKPEQAKTKAHCLDTMIVTLQYPNKFIERLTKLRMIPSNDNPVGSADTLNALSNQIQKRYTECGYPALYLYNDCAELFGWI